MWESHVYRKSNFCVGEYDFFWKAYEMTFTTKVIP